MSEETHKKEHDEKHLEKLTIKELREIAADIPHEKAIHEMKKRRTHCLHQRSAGYQGRKTG